MRSVYWITDGDLFIYCFYLSPVQIKQTFVSVHVTKLFPAEKKIKNKINLI